MIAWYWLIELSGLVAAFAGGYLLHLFLIRWRVQALIDSIERLRQDLIWLTEEKKP